MTVASAGPYANLHLDPDTTTPASHHSVFYRPDALPVAQPTASKHLQSVLIVFVLLYMHTVHSFTTCTLAEYKGLNLWCEW